MANMTNPSTRPLPPLRKGLGQHLLVSEGVLDAIVDAAEVAGTETVVEVGPGTGLLTKRLLQAARRVVAVEIDPAMIQYLRGQFSDAPNLTIIQGDILHQDPAALAPGEPYLVVANLPYYIASLTVRLFLESTHRPRRIVVTVQREVALEMTAASGDLGLQGIGVQVYAGARIVRRIRPGSFVPPPKVDSAVVLLDSYPEPRVPQSMLPRFFTVVRAGFSAPRKQLRNALAQGLGLSPGDADHWLHTAGVDPRRRAETLTIDEWHALTEAAPPGRLP